VARVKMSFAFGDGHRATLYDEGQPGHRSRKTPTTAHEMKVLDIFSGIGGIALGLERAGFTIVGFCEKNPFCRKILNKHWPGMRIYDDVRSLTAQLLGDDGIFPDMLAGGFPCTDLSVAGKGKGIDGPQSGLWWQYHRLVADIRPKLALVENVAAFRARGLVCVLRSLAGIGYDAEWHCIPACAVGAPHRRDRIWILAYPSGQQFARHQREVLREPVGTDAEAGRQDIRLADPEAGPVLAGPIEQNGWWQVKPRVGRVAFGIPARLDRVRLRALGNAAVPQIAELIGRAIVSACARDH
jgi:DNA (cytosine-5)-methyltransferase 1